MIPSAKYFHIVGPTMSALIRTAILGASGYTGSELVRLLANHPHVKMTVLTADRRAGKPYHQVFPHLGGLGLPDLTALEEVDFSSVDVVFCALPHGATQEVVSDLFAKHDHLKIIDLSADFRLEDEEVYAQWYGHAHKAPHLQPEAVYGLTEWNREAIAKTRLVACPGCYPTSVQLPLIPLFKAGLIRAEDLIIDAKSGVTGAGRAPKEGTLFS
ncbi:MAG: N-acetyl-gamma-glutamyl-phosphate reductase, partial [Alphaproteobacteria bacterium RIFOXYD12_FULL_60_8]